MGKGNVFATAQIAGIQAAKRTAELIPLCHPLPLSNVEIDFQMKGGAVNATCSARTTAQTGVEMEALVGVAIALLTIYDMCKAIDKEMEISDVHLVKKTKHLVCRQLRDKKCKLSSASLRFPIAPVADSTRTL